MPDPKLRYEILPPSTILEASFSAEPDDDSEADITIEAINDLPGSITLSKIQFILPVAALTADASVKKNALTAKPARIQPVAREPNDWAIKFLPDGVGPGTVSFEATPLRGGEVAAGARLGFRLLDMVVIDQEGETKIDIGETSSDGPGSVSRKIRKVPPALRIDSFGATRLSTGAVSATGEPVTLNWATTGASLIFLEGLSDVDQAAFLQKFPKPAASSRSDNAANTDLHDSSFDVRPQTTTTYTLRARSNRGTDEAVRQLTITVTDQDKTPFLLADRAAIGSVTPPNRGELAAESKVSAPLIEAASATIGLESAPGVLTVHGTVTADSLTATISAASAMLGVTVHTFDPSSFNRVISGPFDSLVSKVFTPVGGTMLLTISGLVKVQTPGRVSLFAQVFFRDHMELDPSQVQEGDFPIDIVSGDVISFPVPPNMEYVAFPTIHLAIDRVRAGFPERPVPGAPLLLSMTMGLDPSVMTDLPVGKVTLEQNTIRAVLLELPTHVVKV